MSEGVMCPQCRGYANAHNQAAWDKCFAEARRAQWEADVRQCESIARAESERTRGRPTSGEYEIGARNCAAAIRVQKETP